MQGLVDVFCCVDDTTNQILLKQLEDSIANEPINYYQTPAYKGNMKGARLEGIQTALLGPAKYISWIDPDDLVISGAFQKCVDQYITQNKRGLVFTRDQTIDLTGKLIGNPSQIVTDIGQIIRTPRAAHHICVYDKQSLINFLPTFKTIPTNFNCDWITAAIIAYKNGWTQVPFVGYKWRVYSPTQSHQQANRGPFVNRMVTNFIKRNTLGLK